MDYERVELFRMKILRSKESRGQFLTMLGKRASGVSAEIEKRVQQILLDVKKNGDRALIRYTQKFDSLRIRNIRLTHSEITRYAKKADHQTRKALKHSAQRIKKFHIRQQENSWLYTEGKTVLGQIIRPLERVGVYIPGGLASYPSTVLMNVIPAQVAGVSEIALCVPTPRGELNPHVMAAIQMLGIREVYRIGGAQAIGALAYGTETVRKVDKIVGPGNIYVALAKKLVFGEVDIDMIAGPSEILIIGDKTANPVFVAADMLSQAEHDELASAIFVTTSIQLAEAVQRELKKQMETLSRKEIAKKSLGRYGAIIVVRTMSAAVAFSNHVAPEHLEIMTRQPKRILSMIRNAGAIFLGEWTPEALGDYSAGPNHTLPTGGTARFFSPLGVYDFLKRSSLLAFSKDEFYKLAQTVKRISSAEGLDGHKNTIIVRELYKD